MSFQVKFWGVRGSIACPQPTHIGYGGNTSCIEVAVGGHRIILDAGTGVRELGKDIIKNSELNHYMLLTHTHWDHINGFPFFVPAYDSRRKLQVMAGHLKPSGGVQAVMSSQMNNPVFPVPIDAMQAEMTFIDFEAGESFTMYEDVQVRTTLLNHPNGATGYRIEHGGASVCYITDTEHVPGKPDANILGLIEGSNLVIYDCTYTEAEFPSKIGWGHSTWNEAVRLCKMADVGRLAIFHHDPDHDDDFMDALGAEAKDTWQNTVVARELMTLDVG